MKLKKIGLAAFLIVSLTSISYAQTGEFSVIPKFKVGTGEADIDNFYGDYDYNLIGVNVDFLSKVDDYLELGLGIGYDQNMFDGDLGIQGMDDDEVDIDTFQIYGTARFNFDSGNANPYFSAKLGMNSGDTDINYFIYDGINTYYATEEYETDFFFGLALGMEMEQMNIEIGYERTNVEASYDYESLGNGKEDGEYEVFYFAIGYRFK